jgi:hypothetical protein
MITTPDLLFAASTVSEAGKRVGAEWTWYVIRAAGFTAAGLIVLLMLSGIGHVTGFTFRFIEPIKAWLIHKALAYALCVAIAIHIGFLLIDHYIHFSWHKFYCLSCLPITIKLNSLVYRSVAWE